MAKCRHLTWVRWKTHHGVVTSLSLARLIKYSAHRPLLPVITFLHTCTLHRSDAAIAVGGTAVSPVGSGGSHGRSWNTFTKLHKHFRVSFNEFHWSCYVLRNQKNSDENWRWHFTSTILYSWGDSRMQQLTGQHTVSCLKSYSHWYVI